VDGDFFISLMSNVGKGSRLRIFPLDLSSEKAFSFPCRRTNGEIFEITEAFEGTLDSYNDVAIRIITDNGLCLILLVSDLGDSFGIERVW
jgi:hypothetical protein